MKRVYHIWLVVFICASTCYGWGVTGHKTAAKIAEHFLSPQAKVEVTKLLGDKTMADVAIWGDHMATQPAYRWTQPHGAYVINSADSFDMQRDCPDGKCVVARVNLFHNTLKDPQTTLDAKADALRFLIHFIPDMHSPVHIVRKKNKAVRVKFFGQDHTLHMVWDNFLIDRLKKTPTDYVDVLVRQITGAKVTTWTKDMDPVSWATESLQRGIKTAYVLPADGRVGQDYVDRCMPIVHERLSVAGVRLAAVLNNAFGSKLPNVLIIGDSISMGYTRVVKGLLKGRANVQHPKANCGDTRKGLANIEQWLGDTQWDVIHFNWGLHDLCYRNAKNPALKSSGYRDKVNGRLSVPLPLYEQNLEKLVQQLKTTGAKLIWASTTLVPEGEQGRFAGDDKKYNDAAAKVMRRHGIEINDLYVLTKGFSPDLFKGPTNVHYTKEGARRLGKAVAEAIEKVLSLSCQSQPAAAM